MSNARHVVTAVTMIALAVTLAVAPAALSAQRVSMGRAGIQPHVALTLPARADTVTVDSTAPHRSRAVDAVGGGLVGTIIGGLVGAMYASDAQKHCGDGPCLVGLAIPFGAAVGLVGGVIIGAVLPTH